MNFYEILNISKTANPEEIKKAFRIKAQQYHPDKNPNNPEAERKFKEINSAYEILSNKQKKEEYDKKDENKYIKVWQDTKAKVRYMKEVEGFSNEGIEKLLNRED